MSDNFTVTIQPDTECNVFVSAIVHLSSVMQRCTIVATGFRHNGAPGEPSPPKYLEGQGLKELMVDTSDNKSTNMIFGPYPYGVTLKITFEHRDGDQWNSSSVIGNVEMKNNHDDNGFKMFFQRSSIYASVTGREQFTTFQSVEPEIQILGHNIELSILIAV